MQNHRDIVKEFEFKLEEFSHTESVSKSKSVDVSMHKEDVPQVIYVQGKRQTVVNGIPIAQLPVGSNVSPDKRQTIGSNVVGSGLLDQPPPKLDSAVDASRRSQS